MEVSFVCVFFKTTFSVILLSSNHQVPSLTSTYPNCHQGPQPPKNLLFLSIQIQTHLFLILLGYLCHLRLAI